jgi:hypothetical protein
MIKMLNGYRWLEDELGEDTKEIKQLLDQGLIKRIYEDTAKFIVLESDIPKVKEILGDDYNKLGEYTVVEWIKDYFCGNYEGLRIDNLYGDYVDVRMEQICDLISDDEELYFPNDKKLEVYNAECPYEKMEDVLNEIGRRQAKMQIQDLLNSINNQVFV